MSVEFETIRINYNRDQSLELFYKPVYLPGDVFRQHRVMPGVYGKKKMKFITTLKKQLRKWTNCELAPTKGFAIEEREIESFRIKSDWEQCGDAFFESLFEEIFETTGLLEPNGTIVRQFIEKRYRESMIWDKSALSWFGDVSKTTDAFFSIFDGWWKKISNLVDADHTQYVSTGTGSALAANAAKAIFQEMYEVAPNVLRMLPDVVPVYDMEGMVVPNTHRHIKYIPCTKSLYDNYLVSLESKATDAAHWALVNGIRTPLFRGMPVVQQPEWDEILGLAPFSITEPHYCLMTTPLNNVIATDVISPRGFENLRIWYDIDQEKMKGRSRGRLGADIVHPDLVVAGY